MDWLEDTLQETQHVGLVVVDDTLGEDILQQELQETRTSDLSKQLTFSPISLTTSSNIVRSV